MSYVGIDFVDILMFFSLFLESNLILFWCFLSYYKKMFDMRFDSRGRSRFEVRTSKNLEKSCQNYSRNAVPKKHPQKLQNSSILAPFWYPKSSILQTWGLTLGGTFLEGFQRLLGGPMPRRHREPS